MPNEAVNMLGMAESTALADLDKLGAKTVKTPEEAAKLPEGTEFVDPSGKKRVVPFRPRSIEDVDSLPEGSEFVDPSGKLRKTPTYQGLDFTTQTLYDMAATDKEREKILNRAYSGKVKRRERTGELYVEEEGGVLRRSKGFTQAPGAFAAAQAAPVLGSIAGEIGGGVAGAAGGPVGAFGGAVAGGAAGGAAGQAFNDAILALAGVYDRSAGQEAGRIGRCGAIRAAVVRQSGRVIAGAARHQGHSPSIVLPKILPHFLAPHPGGLRCKLASIARARRFAPVPPGPMFPELPHVIQNIVEVFDPAFHTQKPLLQSATDYYEKSSWHGLAQIQGNWRRETGQACRCPQAAVSTEKAGEAVLGRTRDRA